MPLKKATLLLLLLSRCILQAEGQKFKFDSHEIGAGGDRVGQTSLVDLDRDGDLDWVFGRLGTMSWYEFISPNEWKLHEMGQGATTDVGGCPYDVNDDGWMDYIVGDSWYENTGEPREEPFIFHHKNMIGSHDNVVVDVDGDGRADVVSVSNDLDHPVLAWYRMPEDIEENWQYHKIGKGIHGGIAPRGYGDLDSDGDMDLVRGDAWFENLEKNEWKQHNDLTPLGGSRPDKYGLSLRSWCIDLDGDGDLDIIQAEADTQNGRVFWFESQDNARTFVFHLISADLTNQDFHSLAVADFDSDGDLDVVSGGGPLSLATKKLFLWENTMGKGQQWKEHVLLEGKESHETVAADVDGDGDIDICTKPWKGGMHLFLENRLVE